PAALGAAPPRIGPPCPGRLTPPGRPAGAARGPAEPRLPFGLGGRSERERGLLSRTRGPLRSRAPAAETGCPPPPRPSALARSRPRYNGRTIASTRRIRRRDAVRQARTGHRPSAETLRASESVAAASPDAGSGAGGRGGRSRRTQPESSAGAA